MAPRRAQPHRTSQRPHPPPPLPLRREPRRGARPKEEVRPGCSADRAENGCENNQGNNAAPAPRDPTCSASAARRAVRSPQSGNPAGRLPTPTLTRHRPRQRTKPGCRAAGLTPAQREPQGRLPLTLVRFPGAREQSPLRTVRSNGL